MSDLKVIEVVKDRYATIAKTGESCGCGCGVSETLGYGKDDLATVPEGSDLGLGCGAPVPKLQLKPGETVVDLGSGPGLDAFLAARQVGAQGKVIGVDMTPEMLERARTNAAKGGYANVEFREGRLEHLPVADASVDAITSNCVINLVPDKAKVFSEIARVLKPGGRVVVSDIILDGELPEPLASDLLAWAGCVAGAIRRETYFGQVKAAGLTDVETLSDIDYLAGLGGELPAEVNEKLDRAGITPADLAGKVRSVTWRAYRR